MQINDRRVSVLEGKHKNFFTFAALSDLEIVGLAMKAANLGFFFRRSSKA